MTLLPLLFSTFTAKAIKSPHVGKRVVSLDSILTKTGPYFFFLFLSLVLFYPFYLSLFLSPAPTEKTTSKLEDG